MGQPRAPAVRGLSVDALVLALRVTFRGDGLRARIGLLLDADELTATVDGDAFTIMRGAPGDADAVITAAAATLRGVVFGGRPLPDDVRDDRAVAERFVRLFPRPEASARG